MYRVPAHLTTSRVRRNTALPAYLESYELPHLKNRSKPPPEPFLQDREDNVSEEEFVGARGGQRTPSPCSQASLSEFLVADEWPLKETMSTKEPLNQETEKEVLLKKLETMKRENNSLLLEHKKTASKLDQLNHQSQLETHQLRQQVDKLNEFIQKLQITGPLERAEQPLVKQSEETVWNKRDTFPLPRRLPQPSKERRQRESSTSEEEEEYWSRKAQTRPKKSRYRLQATHKTRHSRSWSPESDSGREQSYRGPMPTIPNMTQPSPREFSRLRIALENLLPSASSERFKYQILVDHLQNEEALLIADSYVNSRHPFRDTMAALDLQYGQPHQLALQRIVELMDGPDIGSGDIKAFRMFALRVRSLVGMLEQLGRKGKVELECGSHVARLLAKLPHDLRSNFRRFIHPHQVPIPTLLDLADWLEFELQVQEDNSRFGGSSRVEKESKNQGQRYSKSRKESSTVLLSTGTTPYTEKAAVTPYDNTKRYCPFCDNEKHSLNNCENFKLLSPTQKRTWIKNNSRCWRCGRSHRSAECDLKMRCKTCNSRHLLVLHDINERAKQTVSKGGKDSNQPKSEPAKVNAEEVLYIDRPLEGRKVLLKLSKIVLRNKDRTMEAYAILDDGSERTILLHSAAHQLGLEGPPEDLHLRTVRQELQTVHGAVVSFTISAVAEPHRSFHIKNAFTAKRLGLAEHTYPVQSLQARYRHLQGLPLQPFHGVHPVLLIGSDHPHLITPVEPVRLGPPGGPAAVRTRLGWTLQGPAHGMKHYLAEQQCFFTATTAPSSDLYSHVERLWQMDTLPWQNKKQSIRSRQDTEAIAILESRTTRMNIDGVLRYATPLLRVQNMPQLHAPKEAVLPQLRSIERRLSKEPEKAEAYVAEVQRLVNAGYVHKLAPGEENTPTSWYIPHHMVAHNGKNRVVFNCSFEHKGHNLNKLLLPGPALGPPLLAVLLRFREHAVAFSSDIRGMFHQIRLLPEDQPLLRFLWRDLKREEPPDIYQWSVLPFGTTCSPCCAVFALQRHIMLHSKEGEAVRDIVLQSFYVDNCLRSVTSEDEAKVLVHQLQETLASGGFELRQWASNQPSVIANLPPDIQSDSVGKWIAEGQLDVHESALGLHWHCPSDTLAFKHRPIEHSTVTMRTIYQVLASQYDPLGFILPYTTRAKVIVQQLWNVKRDWDDPSLPEELLNAWNQWESELPTLRTIQIPRCYSSPELDSAQSIREIHIFCDASERAYGSVAYLRTEAEGGEVEIAFLSARSRVAPKKQQSIPRLELCGALSGAQQSKVLREELTIPITSVTHWTDSTTVLAWLQSDSCRYKVFVGTRVAEIQDLTDRETWRYVDTASNPADDITRGKSLAELTADGRWFRGPAFLWRRPDQWPQPPQEAATVVTDSEELKKITFCGLTINLPPVPDVEKYKTFQDLVKATALCLSGQTDPQLTADNYREAENILLQKVQRDCFELDHLQLINGKPLPSSSRLLSLAPELDSTSKLIRVGGRLRQATALDKGVTHPVVLDPKHKITQLLIQQYDDQLHHPGSERVFAELRRNYWILRGREAVRRIQHHCMECRRWRSKPLIPRMADLPPARLRLHRPAFYSTGVDCFGPYTIKIGRRTEKRWGIIFKCMTTRAVHLDLVPSIDCDSFLMALRRFVARRGKPFELLSDNGTNFKAGERELRESFATLTPGLQSQLAAQQIKFVFNPPSAPHFGGCWEREIKSLKQALQVTIGSQSVTEEVLQTVLIEIESILNSKPLGYTSSDVADPDPVTPNTLLMGRPDASLPQVVYPESELLSRRRWRHSQLLADNFWRSFIRSYLPSLQTRQKWLSDPASLSVGTTVLVVDPQLPRAMWPIGKIAQTIPGPDGRVRVVEVKVGDRSYTRPVARVIELPSLPE